MEQQRKRKRKKYQYGTPEIVFHTIQTFPEENLFCTPYYGTVYNFLFPPVYWGEKKKSILYSSRVKKFFKGNAGLFIIKSCILVLI